MLPHVWLTISVSLHVSWIVVSLFSHTELLTKHTSMNKISLATLYASIQFLPYIVYFNLQIIQNYYFNARML